METAKDDIHHIRRIMERSSTFLSLSGLSGISAGASALLASGLAWQLMYKHQINYLDGITNSYSSQLIIQLIGLACLTFIVAILTGYYFTRNKAKKLNLSLWTNTSKAMLIHLLIPLITGACLCLILISYNLFVMVAPTTLLFYGLSLVSASKFSHREIFTLGSIEIVLSLIGFLFPGYGLLIWALGFGVFHILYGIIMHIKYQ
ncbi:MAG: hypothetical protein ABI851_03830 [Saprospiraceae bacterium]